VLMILSGGLRLAVEAVLMILSGGLRLAVED
jgi:hypothetical protein